MKTNSLEKSNPTPLKLAEARTLNQIIKRGLQTFVETGNSLMTMRDRRGYSVLGYETFEAYAIKELGLGRSSAYDYIGAAQVVGMSERSDIEYRQAAELARLSAPSKNGDKRKRVIDAEAVKEVSATLDFRTATVKQVSKAVDSHLSKKRNESLRAARDVAPKTEGGKTRLITVGVSGLESHIPHATIDAIITDPPYPEKFLPVYAELAIVAVKLLKPGAPLVVMVGHSHLPEILASMTPHIKYLWTVAYITPANTARVFSAKALVNWKPILVFSNGPYAGEWYADVVNNSAPDKRYHEWGQGESGMAALIDRFSLPGQTILDPFCGGSATGAAAIKMDRLYIGSDIDPDAIEISAHRLVEIVAE